MERAVYPERGPDGLGRGRERLSRGGPDRGQGYHARRARRARGDAVSRAKRETGHENGREILPRAIHHRERGVPSLTQPSPTESVTISIRVAPYSTIRK